MVRGEVIDRRGPDDQLVVAKESRCWVEVHHRQKPLAKSGLSDALEIDKIG